MGRSPLSKVNCRFKKSWMAPFWCIGYGVDKKDQVRMSDDIRKNLNTEKLQISFDV